MYDTSGESADHFPASRSPAAHEWIIALAIAGNALAEFDIQDGDYALIDTRKAAYDGDFALVQDGPYEAFGRVFYMDDNLIVESPAGILLIRGTSAEVIGKFTGIQRLFR